MSKLIIRPTENTPAINFDLEKGYLEIKGVSYPEYAKEFFEPVLDKLREYVRSNPPTHTEVAFKFTYFNTGTNAPITAIFKELESLVVLPGFSVEVVWYYETDDEDMRELGEYFRNLTSLEIKIVEVESF